MSDLIVRHGEVISRDERDLISDRYHTITKTMNKIFWGFENDPGNNSMYVGSYGRGTAIDTSDIDILVVLPNAKYYKYINYNGNGPSRLLQEVSNALKTHYWGTDIHADGQVIVINFSDGMKIEVLPAFDETPPYTTINSVFKYPDSNMGGHWLSTNPKAEQEAMRGKNRESNGLLFDTCKHIRYIRDNHFKSYHLPGIIIDSFVYTAIGDWHWPNKNENANITSPDAFERNLLIELNQIIDWNYTSLPAPGSDQIVKTDIHCLECLRKVLNYIIG